MKIDGLDHPKTFQFAELLNLKRAHAIGHLELFFAFAAKLAPQGDIGKWQNGSIARACDWDEGADKFIEALIGAGFIEENEEYRLIVHDWHEHAPNWVKAKLKKEEKQFVNLKEKKVTPNSSADVSSDVSSDISPKDAIIEEIVDSNLSSENKENDISWGISTGISTGIRGQHHITKPSLEKKRKNIKKEKKIPESTNDPPSKIDTEKIFEFWRQAMNHPRAVLDNRRKRRITEAVKMYGVERLQNAIAGCKLSDFHMGRTPQSTAVYDDLMLILRDSSNIEKFEAIYEQHKPKQSVEKQKVEYEKQEVDKKLARKKAMERYFSLASEEQKSVLEKFRKYPKAKPIVEWILEKNSRDEWFKNPIFLDEFADFMRGNNG